MRIADISHSTTGGGFLPMLIDLVKQNGFASYPGDGTNLWNAVHTCDLASLFRLALEKGEAGAIGSRLGLPVVSIPMDELIRPAHYGFLTNIVTKSYPASNHITRRDLGWEPTQPSLLADLYNGH